MTIKNGVMFVGGHGTLRYKDGARNIGHRWIKTIREDVSANLLLMLWVIYSCQTSVSNFETTSVY